MNNRKIPHQEATTSNGKIIIRNQDYIIREQSKFEQMNEQFLGEQNIKCINHSLKLPIKQVTLKAQSFLTEHICERAKYYLPIINQMFIYEMKALDIHPYTKSLFHRNDPDQINYEQMIIKNMYDYQDKEPNMQKMMDMNKGLIKQKIQPQPFRYLERENTRNDTEFTPPIKQSFSYWYEHGDSQYQQKKYDINHC